MRGGFNMITNERQYKITKRQLIKLRKAIAEFNLFDTAQRLGSDILATAELDALNSEEENLNSQLLDYENLKSGTGIKLRALSLSELPRILIQARIMQHLSQRELADLVGLKEQQIQRYESEEYSSSSLRRLLEIAEALKIKVTEIAEISLISKTPESRKIEIVDWRKFPIKEMYRRGWFEGFSESLDSVLLEGEMLTRDFIQSVIKRPLIALHRLHIRSGSEMDQYALLAWECRILSLSVREKNIGNYQRQSLTSAWIAKFVQLSRLPDGPLQAKEMLREAGIALIIEPHLASTFLDGAALLYGDTPVIGMTLRYDRLDNFWFVLLHELMHVINHLHKDKFESIFDDLDVENYEKIELEADRLAGEALIQESEWSLSLARYTRSKEAVIDFSEKLGISHAIVAGRIRREANNFIILNELVGQGEVRKHFRDVFFGI
jgi:HTH-type transcriptional regulator/antitoxin HigA